MLKDVVGVEATGEYRLRVEFEDGVAGEVDVAALDAVMGLSRSVPGGRLSLRVMM